MPVYVYKAVTDKGLIVKNKVEEASKQSLVKRLKNNGITPIEIIQVAYKGRGQTKKKKNVTDIQEIIKNVNTTQVGRNSAIKQSQVRVCKNLQNCGGLFVDLSGGLR